MARRRLRPFWYLLAAVPAVAGLWWAGPRLLGRLDFFQVRRVELVGLHNLSRTAVLDGLRIPARLSVFADLKPIEQRAAKLAGVSSAQVSRRLPGALVVQINEIAPVALVPRDNAMALIDARGRVLPFDPTLGAPDLPVAATADSALAGLLARVREAEPGLFSRVTSAERDEEDVVLDLDAQRFLFRPDAPAEVIRAVLAVAQDLDRRNRPFRELDGRFAGQVVVRGLGGAGRRGGA